MLQHDFWGLGWSMLQPSMPLLGLQHASSPRSSQDKAGAGRSSQFKAEGRRRLGQGQPRAPLWSLAESVLERCLHAQVSAWHSRPGPAESVQSRRRPGHVRIKPSPARPSQNSQCKAGVGSPR